MTLAVTDPIGGARAAMQNARLRQGYGAASRGVRSAFAKISAFVKTTADKPAD